MLHTIGIIATASFLCLLALYIFIKGRTGFLLKRGMFACIGILIITSSWEYQTILAKVMAVFVSLIGLTIVLGALNIYKKVSDDLGLIAPEPPKEEKAP